jgi:hypothetical protein
MPNNQPVVMYIGVIDILQQFRVIKRMEHTFKAMVHDGVCDKAPGSSLGPELHIRMCGR